jgi:hypothetical protein
LSAGNKNDGRSICCAIYINSVVSRRKQIHNSSLHPLFTISDLQIVNLFDTILLFMLGQDIAVLLKLSLQEGPRVLSKKLADELFLSTAEISKSLNRCKDSGLLYWSDMEKRVNRSALLEFLAHGMRYAFPPVKGGMVRGIPTATATKPLNSQFLDDREPPPVWPYPEGTVRGLSFAPLFKSAPKAALADSRLYELLALCDAIRGGRTRERVLAIELLGKALNA